MGLPRDERIGRYELLIELGRGGMAELFLGRLEGVGGFFKLVAIKRILPHLAQDPQFKELFLNEGRIAAHLSHPNVCQVFELEESGGELFLAMEYLDGVSWDQLSAAIPRGPQGLWLTAGVLAQAAEGLHYAHTLRDVSGNATPVIHRDVSPHNLFVTVDGVCKVLDFGVSKMMTDGPRTRTGVIKGKLPYMAPEQIRGDTVDGRADVFSLGVCAWEALAGQRLFDRSTDFQIWKAITEEPIAPIASLWPECPPAVEAVVQRSLARGREHRYATAREFGEALVQAAGGTASLADIAQAVRVSCGDRIAERQRQVATAVSSRNIDRNAASTIRDTPPAEQGATMNLRQQSARVERPVESSAAATRDLQRSSGPTLEQPAAEPEPPVAPKRGGTMKLVVVAVVAAAAAAVIAVVAMKGSGSATPAAPVAAPGPTQPATLPPDATEDPDDPMVRLQRGEAEIRQAGEQLKQLEKLKALAGSAAE